MSTVALVVAGCILAFYFFHQRKAPVATAPTPESQNQMAGNKQLPGQPSKPQAATYEPAAPSLPSPTSRKPAPQAEAPQNRIQPAKEIARQPEPVRPVSPPPIPPAPAVQRSGIMHYQGPPVPYNGAAVFDHLPPARLKFSYDRQGWALTIKSNPDGTKRVTLTSLKPGYQANCDLGWEIVE